MKKEKIDEKSAQSFIDKGIAIYHGEGVKRKYAIAANYFIKAAKTSAKGLLWYAKCKFYGNGLYYDPNRAFELFSQAAQGGVSEADYYIGLCYLDGIGVDYNLEKAFHIFSELSDNLYFPATHQLGLCYFYGKGVHQDIIKAYEYFKDASKNGYFLSELFCLSNYKTDKIMNDQLKGYADQKIKNDDTAKFEYGKFLQQVNPEVGLQYIKKAAENHDRNAQCYLGKIYFGVEKWDVDVDYAKACKCFRKAANHGSYEGMYFYGLLKIFYHDLEKYDLEGGVKLMKDAADHYVVDAIYHYGNFLFNGTGVQKDAKLACEYYQKATIFGHMNALVKYCRMLVEGKYVDKDLETAEHYLKWAAERRCKQAALDYADYLKNGVFEGGTIEMICSYYAKGGALIDMSVEPRTTKINQNENSHSDGDYKI